LGALKGFSTAPRQNPFAAAALVDPAFAGVTTKR
jgi:hypothetical protein